MKNNNKNIKKRSPAKKKTTSTEHFGAKEANSSSLDVIPHQEITAEVIAACAYNLWEQDGRPNGRDMEYWLRAENQLKPATTT